MVWGRLAKGFSYSPVYTIMGGTSNVLRNIIGERVLGLPRDWLTASGRGPAGVGVARGGATRIERSTAVADVVEMSTGFIVSSATSGTRSAKEPDPQEQVFDRGDRVVAVGEH